MRKIPTLAKVLITSFVLTLSGLAANSVAVAGVNETVTTTFSFSTGSSVLTKAQKAEIKKAVAKSGADATFVLTGSAGRLPGVSDDEVKSLAQKRGQVVKAYLGKLGVKKSSITVKVKITRFGIVPRTKIVASFSDASPSPSASPSASELACASGGTCVVGDTGPGSGIVYYVHNTPGGFACGPTLAATCQYLEVAPSGWNAGADPVKAWATGTNMSGNTYLDVDGIVNDEDNDVPNNNASAIGLGYKNSDFIVAQNGAYIASINDYAAGATRAYAGGSKNDWYLPTTTELNLLCQWNRGVTQLVTTGCTGGIINSGVGASLSGFAGVYYWSSSEVSNDESWSQTFYNGEQYGYASKHQLMYVRPIRAF